RETDRRIRTPRSIESSLRVTGDTRRATNESIFRDRVAEEECLAGGINEVELRAFEAIACERGDVLWRRAERLEQIEHLLRRLRNILLSELRIRRQIGRIRAE